MTAPHARPGNPFFSVIIPTHDRKHFLQEALASVGAQRFRDFEVIVVDDGSTDGTRDYLESMKDSLRFITQPNSGPGAARNGGARMARGEYLAFLDSDDRWFEWTLETAAEAIERHGRPALVCAALVEFGDPREIDSIRPDPAKDEYFADYLDSSAKGYFVGAGMTVIRRDVFERSGGFDTGRMNCEDHDLALRVGTEKGFVKILAPKTIAWRRHAGSATTRSDAMYRGADLLIQHERKGVYPGGSARRRHRREILTRHVRPITMQLAASSAIAGGWNLYLRTFAWNLALGRLLYLLLYPVLALRGFIVGRSHG